MIYRNFLVQAEGLGATDGVNKFLVENPAWNLWQVIPYKDGYLIYILEGPTPKKPGDSTSGGALREGATLSERVNASKLRLVA